MVLNGINYLVTVTQMKASAANDADLESQTKPISQTSTGFETYFEAIKASFNQSETLASSVLKKRDDTANAVIGKI